MRTATTLVCITLLSWLGPLSAQAQSQAGKRSDQLKEIKAQRVAYLTSELALTPAEAQVFWPIYNEMDQERELLKRERPRSPRVNGSEAEPLSEQEALALLKERHRIAQQELDLERRYDDRFLKAIGAPRTVDLHRAEQDFRREVVRRFKERMRQDGGRGKGSPSKP